MPAQTVIQVRRDTAANWASTNPTLAEGEIGYETDTGKFKIGKMAGSPSTLQSWVDLDYSSGSASVVISETAPTAPEPGNVWYNSTEGTSYIYYDDTWVPLSPAIVGPEGPQGPTGATGPQGPQGDPGVGVPTIDSATTGEMLVSNGTTASWSNTVTANSTAVPALIAKGITSQATAIQEWQNSGGTALASIGSTGRLTAPGVNVNSTQTSVIPLEVKGAVSQSTYLQVWRTSDNTIVSAIDIDGAVIEPATNAVTARASGYVGMPQQIVTNAGGGITLNKSHAGKHLYLTDSATTITIPPNSGAGSVPFEIGTTIVIINSAFSSTISITSDTLRQAGTTSSGQRTLAPWGMATLVKITSTSWIISGNGLS